MKAALYARVSTSDKNQDPENQLFHLRSHAEAQGLEVVGEYVDRASALDHKNRKALRELDKDARSRKFTKILIWKFDRMFRSVAHMHKQMSIWRDYKVDLESMDDRWDTSTSEGRLHLNLLASFAEFEMDLIRESTASSIQRRIELGLPVGADRIEASDPELAEQLMEVYEALDRGENNISHYARTLGIKRSTLSKKYKTYRETKS